VSGTSQIQQLADIIAASPDPLGVLAEAVAELTPVQLAHVRHNWALWARPNQVVPQGPWKTFGCCTGIGWGKTRTLGEFVTQEVTEGRATSVGLCAQNEDKTFDVMVDGKSGLLALSPWWCKARFEGGKVVWANGVEGSLYTPEAPGAMRGPEHDLIWLSEIVAWPRATMEEALSNILRRARIGYGKVVWDTTPTARHPLIRKLLARAAHNPTVHIVVRGEMFENVDNLTEGYVEDQYATYGGTRQGEEELRGIYRDDAEDAMFRQAWIDKSRRNLPDRLERRIISVDPAITAPTAAQPNRRSDATGILDMGLGVDGQVYAIRNLTGVHRHEVWSAMVVDAYVAGGCDLVWLETNAGGTGNVALLRVAAKDRGLEVVELGKEETPGRRAGVVYVRPINTKGSKGSRAGGAAALTERGRVSFVNGGQGLDTLEDRLCVFDGSERTPDNEVDAFVHGCHELAGLGREARPDGRRELVATTAALQRMAGAGAGQAREAPSVLSRLRGPWRGPAL
jgi:phage terminase large subunit-like protein